MGVAPQCLTCLTNPDTNGSLGASSATGSGRVVTAGFKGSLNILKTARGYTNRSMETCGQGLEVSSCKVHLAFLGACGPDNQIESMSGLVPEDASHGPSVHTVAAGHGTETLARRKTGQAQLLQERQAGKLSYQDWT